MPDESPWDSRHGWWVIPFAALGAIVWTVLVILVWRWVH